VFTITPHHEGVKLLLVGATTKGRET
jgi:hypothetical protein